MVALELQNWTLANGFFTSMLSGKPVGPVGSSPQVKRQAVQMQSGGNFRMVGTKHNLFVSHFSRVYCTLDIPIFRHLEMFYRIGVRDNASRMHLLWSSASLFLKVPVGPMGVVLLKIV